MVLITGKKNTRYGGTTVRGLYLKTGVAVTLWLLNQLCNSRFTQPKDQLSRTHGGSWGWNQQSLCGFVLGSLCKCYDSWLGVLGGLWKQDWGYLWLLCLFLGPLSSNWVALPRPDVRFCVRYYCILLCGIRLKSLPGSRDRKWVFRRRELGRDEGVEAEVRINVWGKDKLFKN